MTVAASQGCICKLKDRKEVAEGTSIVHWAAKDNPKYKLVASMTEMKESHQPWNGETGLIDQGTLGRHLKGAASPIYYIAGRPLW